MLTALQGDPTQLAVPQLARDLGEGNFQAGKEGLTQATTEDQDAFLESSLPEMAG